MRPVAPRPPLPALLALLWALLPGPGGAQTSVHPKAVIIPRGGSVVVNCSTSCEQHKLLGLETVLNKKEVASGSNWETYELSSVQEDTTPFCYSTCNNNEQSQAIMSLTVYWLPERVELAPLPPWQPVGENLTLRCQVAGGAPRTNLSVMLLQGEKLLSLPQPAGATPVAEVTATVLARRDDHGTNFSCRTELDLRPQGLGLFQNSSVPRQLRTFVLPEVRPHLAAPKILEVGTRASVTCTMDGLFPVSEAQVHLALEDQRLEPRIDRSKDSLLATARVEATPGEEGSHPLTCAVSLGNQRRSTQEYVTIYSFPAPNLTLSESEVPEGTEVSVECKAHAGAAVTLSWGPDGSPLPRAQTTLNATAEDDGREFLCSAMLVVAGEELHKHKTQKLSVLHGPRLDQETCPGNWTWEEDTPQTLRCQALGNPTPTLACRREGDRALLPIGDLRPVTRAISGTYVCRATSSRGAVTHEVVVNVIYRQSNLATILAVAGLIVGLAGTVGLAAYLYNRQRKIRKYKLQKAQEQAAMKLNSPP
ncbi:intercellular adhesion molecule 1 [Pipistrellus kuhlii]|uniref:Intercellular adhesion molecule 1 n=1 Tax=Pipistrellus kuhlii TaxID=59472 RepID=A0A7J7TA21_PIPKU|nr:intercellular adhesion molecule 1 [Pipistrellus kuhlii]KAF6297546.1 intercellular adhesion molecule 1 [Pipistrellus kuhlii]